MAGSTKPFTTVEREYLNEMIRIPTKCSIRIGPEISPLTVKDKNGNTNTYTYDARGNAASLTYPSGKQVNYTYDTKNNLTNVSDGRYGATPKVTTFTYDSNGNMTQKNDAGRVTNYGYNIPGIVNKPNRPAEPYHPVDTRRIRKQAYRNCT